MRMGHVLLAILLVACARPRTDVAIVPDVIRADADTLVGRAYDMSEEPDTRVMALQLRDGTTMLMGGPLSVTMRALARVGSGVEVWVAGKRDSTAFFVDAFEVRRVGPQPVDDGVVNVIGNRVTLLTRRGERVDVPDAPAPLRYLDGSRVWVTRAVPVTFGIIVRR
ncbi:MAG: hypothetical protein WD801_12340 [Gemmatimonadaceae bacterium]